MVAFESCDVRLGTQSWTEEDWDGVFYPRGVAPTDRLRLYASAFDTVEIDSTFYAIPPVGRVRAWAAAVPDGFLFTAKVPQSITHDPDPASREIRRPLEGKEAEFDLFVATMRELGPKLGALLLQLPPQFHFQPERLEVLARFLEGLPRDLRFAVEFRHRGWLRDEVYDLLARHDVALALQDLYYMPRRVLVTTDFAYIRLQGKRQEIVRMDAVQIQRDEALDFWAEAVRDLARRVRRVFVQANNHYQGHSPGTIRALQARLGLPVARVPASAPPASDPGEGWSQGTLFDGEPGA